LIRFARDDVGFRVVLEHILTNRDADAASIGAQEKRQRNGKTPCGRDVR